VSKVMPLIPTNQPRLDIDNLPAFPATHAV